ncbi:MAG: GNAT family N-acetyltransferase [Ferruginibacter sp.]|nr:GNAT family N-acetyltransferase [Cytophagales bacterium]
MVETRLITQPDHLREAFRIREEVFVREQNVPAEEEYDAHEDVSRHFLALRDGQPCGTARWRFTDYGIKLERFAVRKDFRGQGVGSALVQAVLDDIGAVEGTRGKLVYMHAQLTAMPLYAKFGFRPVGDRFEECAIPHYKMQRMPTEASAEGASFLKSEK